MTELRVAVVGASSGLGRCIGIGLAQRGAHVALLARRRDRLDDAAREAGAGTAAIECDVTDDASCRSAIAATVAALGGIDALVYAAGIGPLARLVDTDAATWKRVFETNVTGAALMTSAAIAALTESRGVAAYLSSVSTSCLRHWQNVASLLHLIPSSASLRVGAASRYTVRAAPVCRGCLKKAPNV